MGLRRTRDTRRRAGAVLLATLFAVALGATPPAARTVLAAASPLRVQADAVYTLDPAAGRVHVEIDYRVTDLKPDSSQFIYYYRDLAFAIQPEASSVRTSGGASSITTGRHQYYTEATVHLRSDLYYRDSVSFAIRYDLVGGAPRSASPIRVGKAFATFGVWAWGDAGRSSVEVHTPIGFVNKAEGDPMHTTSAAGGQGLRAEPDDPDTFYAIVSSEDSAAYAANRIALAGGVNIVVQAWPEDGTWNATVSKTLTSALPELRTLIGLDWPVTHDLSVRERYTPALEGYAGFFLGAEERIDVTEDLDPLVIVHEASHAWFNDTLFPERWIYEGLAEEYAWRVQTAVGGDAGAGPERPDPADPGHVTLTAWTFPQVIRDQTTDDRERYGYAAAFWVIHQIVESAGVDQMRTAFAAAQKRQTAYVGAGTPESTTSPNDWRRLLDLAEPIDQPDPPAVESALVDFAVTQSDVAALTVRGPAREKYRALLKAGNGWLPPWYVRQSMDSWSFARATTAMDEATAVLALRDRVTTAAEALGLQPDDALRTAYESAKDGFDGATKIATDELAALAAVAGAKAKVEAPPDFVTQVGLIGETPSASYGEARAAFQAGQLDEAVRLAGVATSIIDGAPAAGQERLIIAAAVVLGGLLLLVVLFLQLRRRGRRRTASALGFPAVGGSSLGAAAVDASAPGGSLGGGTLADPSEASPPPSASPPDDEGGPARGDSPDP